MSKISKRLIKAIIYDSFYKNEDYFEVFENPVSNEIESLKKEYSIRGSIDPNGNKYIWYGGIVHSEINNYLQNKINLKYFNFTYDGEKWYSHLAINNITLEECKRVIKDNLDFFSQIGDLNKPYSLSLIKKDYQFNSLNEFLNQVNH